MNPGVSCDLSTFSLSSVSVQKEERWRNNLTRNPEFHITRKHEKMWLYVIKRGFMWLYLTEVTSCDFVTFGVRKSSQHLSFFLCFKHSIWLFPLEDNRESFSDWTPYISPHSAVLPHSRHRFVSLSGLINPDGLDAARSVFTVLTTPLFPPWMLIGRRSFLLRDCGAASSRCSMMFWAERNPHKFNGASQRHKHITVTSFKAFTQRH